MPDGNNRFAKREGISLRESYQKGGLILELLTEYFLVNS